MKLQVKFRQPSSRTTGGARCTFFLIAAMLCNLTFLFPQENSAKENVYRNPLPLGEKLVFKIEWDPPWYMFFLPNMHAGNIEVTLDKDIDADGSLVLKIVFRAYSSGILAKLSGMKIDDEFVFITGSDSLCTMSVSKKILEGKRKRRIDVQYTPGTRQLHMVEYDVAVTPPVLKKDLVKDDIPTCVQDPFSALYDLRRKEIIADTEFTYVIAYDDIVKEIQSRVEGLEAMDTMMGKVPAWKIQASAILGGLFKRGGEFKIWLSADERQIPLQFEVKVSLGRILGKLEEIQAPER